MPLANRLGGAGPAGRWRPLRNGGARGLQFLLDRQNPDGTWPEDATTGTGFPNVFYLTYGMYRDYFPLLALSQFG